MHNILIKYILARIKNHKYFYMKKISLLALGLFASLNYAQSQFSVGAHIGIPMMDVSDVSSLNLGANISYLHTLSPSFKIGAASGYSHFFVKKFGTDAGYIPIAAKGQYIIPKSKFFIDLDLGYAISIRNEGKGGFYTYPKVGYQLGSGELYLGLQTFSNKANYYYTDHNGNEAISKQNFTAGSINLGYNFIFK